MTFLFALLLSEYTFYVLLALAFLSASSNFYSRDYVSGGSVFLFIVAIGLFAYNHYAHISPFLLAIVLPSYLIVGLVWSIIKWRLHVKEEIIDYQQRVNDVETTVNRKWCKDDEDYAKKIEEAKSQYLEILKTQSNTSRQKHRIKSWIAVWPVSMIITCSYNAIDHIYNECIGMFNRITTSLLKSASIPTA